MAADIAIKGTADIEVIKHRIYEVRGMNLKSQIVTSSWEAHARNHQRPGNELGLNKRNNL